MPRDVQNVLIFDREGRRDPLTGRQVGTDLI